MKEKQHLITLLRLLVYVKKLSYDTTSLRSNFRRYIFLFFEFSKYNNQTLKSYRVNKFKIFFELVKHNFIIKSFSDQGYRMVVILPEVTVIKSQQNIYEC